MNNEACIALAIALKDDPIKIIMAADLDRAERSGHKSLWEVFRGKLRWPPAQLFWEVSLYFVTNCL